MPNCHKCANKPEMRFESSAEAIDTKIHPGTSHYMRRSGHPMMAMAATIFGGIKLAANHFLEDVTYKCPQCGYTYTELKRKS